MRHPNEDVQIALNRLNDALCSWERSTGRQSALILREQGGFSHRSVNGKPVVHSDDDMDDETLLAMVRNS